MHAHLPGALSGRGEPDSHRQACDGLLPLAPLGSIALRKELGSLVAFVPLCNLGENWITYYHG